jgi:hypothetical protein
MDSFGGAVGLIAVGVVRRKQQGGIVDSSAEPPGAVDRAGIVVFRASPPLQPARQVTLIVRRGRVEANGER